MKIIPSAVLKNGLSIVFTVTGPPAFTKVLTEMQSVILHTDGDNIEVRNRNERVEFSFAALPAGSKLGVVDPAQYVKYLGFNFSKESAIASADYLNIALEDEAVPDATTAAVNGSVTPVDFSYISTAKITLISHLHLYLTSTVVFTDITFGGGAALANGLQFLVDGVEFLNAKNNRDLVLIGDGRSHPYLAQDSKQLISHFLWSPLRLIPRGGKLTMKVRDNIATGNSFLGGNIVAIQI